MSDLPPPPPPPPSNYGPPPGYVPYQQPAPAGGVCSPIATLTKWLVGLITVGIATQALSLLLQAAAQGSASDFLADGMTLAEFEAKLASYFTISALSAGAAIAQIVILIIWTFRIARNAQVLGRFDQKFKPGATIAVNLLGSCTLGILNFFMWRELWRASDPDALPGDPSWRERSLSPLIALHLGLNLAGVAASIGLGFSHVFEQLGSANSNETLAKELSDQLPLVMVSGLLMIAASVVFLMLVRQLAERHMRASGER